MLHGLCGRPMMAHYTESFHQESLSWPGQTLRRIFESILEMYSTCRNQLVICCYGGYNDLLRTNDFNKIKEDIVWFKQLLSKRSKMVGNFGGRQDLFFMCDILPSPCLLQQGSIGIDQKNPDLNIRGHKLKLLNDWIRENNKNAGDFDVKKLKISSYTTRLRSKRLPDGSLERLYGFRLNQFRQSEADNDKLHICDMLAAKIRSEVCDFGHRVRLELMEKDGNFTTKEKSPKPVKCAANEDLDRQDIHDYDFEI